MRCSFTSICPAGHPAFSWTPADSDAEVRCQLTTETACQIIPVGPAAPARRPRLEYGR